MALCTGTSWHSALCILHEEGNISSERGVIILQRRILQSDWLNCQQEGLISDWIAFYGLRVARYVWFRAVADVILRRWDDEWLLEVKGWLEFVNDFHAEDSIYQRDCNSCFRSGKKIPGADIATLSRKRERPAVNEREDYFSDYYSDYFGHICLN